MASRAELPGLEFFRNAENLEAFRTFPAYRKLEHSELVQHLRIRWQHLCHERIHSVSRYLSQDKQDDSQPSRLDEIRVETSDQVFLLNGVIHGIIGGGTAAYRDLIRTTLRESQEPLLFEAGFNHLYGESEMDWVNIPDFSVLGFVDSCKKGLDAGLRLPLLLAEVILETFSMMKEDIPYHLLDQEYRRGIDGLLPTRLEIEWDRRKAKPLLTFEDYPNLVRRSAFMAAFAEAWCRKNTRENCRIVVGDAHLTEVAHFLQHPNDVPADLRDLADRFTSENPSVQYRLYRARNIFHNTVGGVAGFLGFLPYFAAMIYLLSGM